MKPRFRASARSHAIVYAGEITIDDLRKRFNIPKDAEVFVRVPGGGDWSNQNLDIDKDTPVCVRWEVMKMVDDPPMDGNDMNRRRR